MKRTNYIEEHVSELPAELQEKSRAAYQKFAASGLKFVQGVGCICDLTGAKHRLGKPQECDDRMPRAEHIRGFENAKTRERVLTSHPYFLSAEDAAYLRRRKHPIAGLKVFEGNTLEEVVSESEAFAARHGLIVRVSTDSWYMPGQTLLVEYRVNKEARP